MASTLGRRRPCNGRARAGNALSSSSFGAMKDMRLMTRDRLESERAAIRRSASPEVKRGLGSGRGHAPFDKEGGGGEEDHGCQMAKFDPFLSLDCTRVEGVGAQCKERKGSNFAD